MRPVISKYFVFLFFVVGDTLNNYSLLIKGWSVYTNSKSNCISSAQNPPPTPSHSRKPRFTASSTPELGSS